MPGQNANKILIADDDGVCRTQVYYTLKREGEYQAILANDGEQAWNILQADHAPKLAITDWMMPGVDGLELCRRARRLRPNSYTYFILVTARNYRVEAIAAVNAGIDDYLKKPVDPVELIARVNIGLRLLALEDKIMESHGHSRLLVDESPFPVACLDLRGNIVDANPAFFQMLRYDSVEDLTAGMGRRLFRNMVDYQALIQQMQLREGFDAVDIVFVTKPGQDLTARVWGRPMNYEDKVLYQIVSNYTH